MIPMLHRYGSKEIRTIEQEGNPWFVAMDLCEVLEIKDTSMALSRLDDDEKAVTSLNGTSSKGVIQKRTVSIVNESGMYSLVLSSRKAEARTFKKWLTSEVIPAIRRAGVYVAQMSQAELTFRLAGQNLDLENRVVALEERVDAISTAPLMLAPPVQEVVTQALPAPAVVRMSVKDYLGTIGMANAKGFSQGIGRSATKKCQDQGISIETRRLSPHGATRVKLYPQTVLRNIAQERGIV